MAIETIVLAILLIFCGVGLVWAAEKLHSLESDHESLARNYSIVDKEASELRRELNSLKKKWDAAQAKFNATDTILKKIEQESSVMHGQVVEAISNFMTRCKAVEENGDFADFKSATKKHDDIDFTGLETDDLTATRSTGGRKPVQQRRSRRLSV